MSEAKPRVAADLRDAVGEAKPAIAAAVVVQDGRLVLVRRRVSEGSLSWQFPAGAVEQDETFEQAAVRETAEETGLTVEAVEMLGERVHPSTGRRMGYVACTVKAGTAHVADIDELTDLAWVALDKLSDYVPHGFAPVVQDYLRSRPDGSQ